MSKKYFEQWKRKRGSISVRVHVALFLPTKCAQRGFVQHALHSPGKGTLYHVTQLNTCTGRFKYTHNCLRDVKPRSLVHTYQHSEKKHTALIFRVEDVGSSFFRNDGAHLPHNTASHPSSLQSSLITVKTSNLISEETRKSERVQREPTINVHLPCAYAHTMIAKTKFHIIGDHCLPLCYEHVF